MPFNIGKLVESASKRLSFGSPFQPLQQPVEEPKVAITNHGRHTKTLAAIPGNPTPPPPSQPPLAVLPNPAPPVVTNPPPQPLKPPGDLKPPPEEKQAPRPPPFSPTAPVGGFSASLVPELTGATLHNDVGLAYIYTEGNRKGEVAGTRPAQSSPFKPKLTLSIYVCCGADPPCGYSDTFLPAYLQDGTTKCLSDNQGAICWSKTDAITKKLRYLNLREVAVRDAVRSGAVEIGHIPGKLNLSDIFTKEMRDKPHFIDLRCGLMSPREILE